MTTTAPEPSILTRVRDGLGRLAGGRLAGGRLAGGRLAGGLTTPLLPSDYLDVIDPLLSATRLRGRITAIHPETRDAVTVLIRPSRGWRTHRPGQFLRLGVDVAGVRQWRSYSLTSVPGRADGCVSVTVKAVPGGGAGSVSTHLVRRARVGDLVHLDQPAGDFVLDTPAPAKLLFVTAGSGITPVMGMLRSLEPGPDVASPDVAGPDVAGPDVLVVHSAPTPADVIFGGELRMLAQRGRIRLLEIHTRTDGRLDTDRLAALAPDFAERATWACGPGDMLGMLENHWATTGIAGQLRTERFRPEVIVPGEGGTVTFTDSATTAVCGGTQSLLEAGEAAGVLMPSGCRMGICFGCVAPLRGGAVRDLRTGDLTTAGDGVLVQTCVSGAAGDCAVDL